MPVLTTYNNWHRHPSLDRFFATMRQKLQKICVCCILRDRMFGVAVHGSPVLREGNTPSTGSAVGLIVNSKNPSTMNHERFSGEI